MKPHRMFALTATLLLPALAHAHEGHGKVGAHWHDGDAGAWLLAAAAVALTVWLARRR